MRAGMHPISKHLAMMIMEEHSAGLQIHHFHRRKCTLTKPFQEIKSLKGRAAFILYLSGYKPQWICQALSIPKRTLWNVIHKANNIYPDTLYIRKAIRM